MKKKKKKSPLTLYIARGALISALYVALTYLSAMIGISSGVIQFRISEALCILPVFFPEAIPGLFLGCVLSNVIASATTGGIVIWDIVFGSIATLIGAIGAYALRKLPHKLMPIATIPTLLSNVIIIPLVLMLAYGIDKGYLFLAATVGLGETVCAVIGGSALYFAIKKSKLFK